MLRAGLDTGSRSSRWRDAPQSPTWHEAQMFRVSIHAAAAPSFYLKGPSP